MDIMQSNEDRTGAVLPLFMVAEDAQLAVSEAVKAAGGKMEDFEIVSLSLGREV